MLEGSFLVSFCYEGVSTFVGRHAPSVQKRWAAILTGQRRGSGARALCAISYFACSGASSLPLPIDMQYHAKVEKQAIDHADFAVV